MACFNPAMSREGRRVEPVPSPFVLPDDIARSSPLYGRVSIGPRVWHLFDHGLHQPWGAFQQVSDVGLGALLAADEFLALLRGLADDLLLPIAADDGAADWTPEQTSPTVLAAIRSLYPDVAARPAPLEPTPSPPPSAESPMQDRLIVIVGAGRSGTTWLEELLLSYDDMGGLTGHETWLFHQLRHLWRNFSGDADSGIGTWMDRDHFVAALRRFCDGVLTTAQRRHSPHSHFYVEKTPAHVDRLPEIAAVYPDAWVIHLVRDGRDVARSMSQVPFFEVTDPAAAAALWRRVMVRARADAPSVPRFREIRYEALHDDPARVVNDIRAWVNATSIQDAAVLTNAIEQRVSTHAGTTNRVGPESWRTLSPAALAGVYASAGDELVRAGYASRSQVWLSRLHRLRNSRTTAENASGSSTQGK